MNSRFSFNSPEARNKFFNLVLQESIFSTWKEVYLNLGLNRGVFNDYKSGRLTIPSSVFHALLFNFNNSKKKFFISQCSILEEGWGRIKAGKITYNKHKEIFEKGRRKGLAKMKNKVHHFDINLPVSNKLSYFIGLFIGEGFTNHYGRYHLTQFTGHVLEEKFYREIISRYSLSLFGLEPFIRRDPVKNAIRVNYYSKDLFLLLTKRFGIPRGRKSRTVLIPKIILSSSEEILLSCISGIYDAEGCVFIDKRKVYSKPYPRIDLHMENLRIMRQISLVFNKVELKHVISSDGKRILIYGFSDISNFLKKVHLLNSKHLEKLQSLGFTNN